MKKINLTGKHFGHLTVLKEISERQNGSVVWFCQCSCGKLITVRSNSLISGNTKSCGCFKKEKIKQIFTKHGGKHTRLYSIWGNIKSRCSNPRISYYRYYGGKGIKIHSEWQNDFIKFRNWALAHGYQENLTIDRINNDGDYEPNNCQWLIKSEHNRKTNFLRWTKKNG